MSWVLAEDSTVKQPDFIANKLLENFSFSLQYGSYGNMSNKDLLGYKIQVPYSTSGHWLMGNINYAYLYNSANTVGTSIKCSEVYIYAKK